MKRAFKIWYSRRIVRFKNLVKLARDLTRPISTKWWFSKGNPLISGKSRLVKYYNLARKMDSSCFKQAEGIGVVPSLMETVFYILTGLSPPTSNQWNMKVYRDPLLKIYNNPGGDCYWAGGQTDLYNAYMIFVAILRLNSKYKLSRC